MTAVLAAVLHLNQVKPSPFCVLDDMDAPLDDRTSTASFRVLHVRGKLAVHHHHPQQAHIGMADVLYGVTSRNGISRIVSVKFPQSDEARHRSQPWPLISRATSPVAAEEDAPHKREDTIEIMMASNFPVTSSATEQISMSCAP